MDTPKKRKNDQSGSEDLARWMNEYADYYGKLSAEQYEQAKKDCPPLPDLEEAELEFRSSLEKNDVCDMRVETVRSRMGRVALQSLLSAVFTVILLIGTLWGLRALGDRRAHQNPEKDTQAEKSVTVKNEAPLEQLEEYLVHYNIPLEMMPRWIPDRYTDIDFLELGIPHNSDRNYAHAALKASDGETLYIAIEQFCPSSPVCMGSGHEAGEPEMYHAGGFTFAVAYECYYTESGDRIYWYANGFEQDRSITVSGAASREELLRILDSIGEVTENE